MSNSPKLYIGTSGFYYYHWLGKFYPEDIVRNQLLTYYSQHFNTVEINSTFYHLPRKTTVKNWKESTNENFVFSFKLTRRITHIKRLSLDFKVLDKYFYALSPLANKKHIILIQTPANLKADVEKLKILLKSLPKSFRYAFEFRNQSWFETEIFKLLEKENCALVLADSPKKNKERLWPMKNIETADFFYIRLHGSEKLYRSSYSDEELKNYAELISKKINKGLDVFVYFNNDAEGYAIENALRLKEILML